jgi:transposase
VRSERAKLSPHAAVAKAIDYMLTRWQASPDSSRRDVSASPTTRPSGRCAASASRSAGNTWLFAGSERGVQRAALMYTLIQTAKLNSVDPQAWFADVLVRVADTPQTKLAELLPRNWRTEASRREAV